MKRPVSDIARTAYCRLHPVVLLGRFAWRDATMAAAIPRPRSDHIQICPNSPNIWLPVHIARVVGWKGNEMPTVAQA